MEYIKELVDVAGHKIFDFSDKSHSIDGKIATVIGMIAVALFIFLTYKSIATKGELDYIYGIIGIGDLILGICGVIIASKSFREEETLKFYKKLGLILNLIIVVLFVLLFLTGLFMM